jgi:phage/plasmid-like protein (TIGR03299 family)
MAANVESMFYVGNMPWHREGEKLFNPPDSITAIQRAGLDWEVKKTRLFVEGNIPVDGYYGIIRNDKKSVLGVVREGYTPLQNWDAFTFFDPLIKKGFLEYETAGAIGNGEIIWILAKLKENPTFSVCAHDEIAKYLLLSNSHDGLSAVSMKFTPIRVVCQNTLNLALERGETTRIRHISSIHVRLDYLSVAMGDILRIYEGAEKNFKAMYDLKLNEHETQGYFNALYPVVEEKEIKTESQFKAREKNIKTQNILMSIYNSKINGMLGIRGRLWAAYNAVTEYIDHPEDYRLGENRLLKRIWFGEGEAYKARAYTVALELIKREAA